MRNSATSRILKSLDTSVLRRRLRKMLGSVDLAISNMESLDFKYQGADGAIQEQIQYYIYYEKA